MKIAQSIMNCKHCLCNLRWPTKTGYCAKCRKDLGIRSKYLPLLPRERWPDYRRLLRYGLNAKIAYERVAAGQPLPNFRKYGRSPQIHQREISDYGVIANVSASTYVHERDILGQYRYPFVVEARSLAAVVLRGKGLSYNEIGRILKRDHSTVRSLIQNIDVYRSRNPVIDAAFAKLVQGDASLHQAE